MKNIISFILNSSGERRCALIYLHDIIVVTLSFPLSILIRDNFNIPNQHLFTLVIGTAFSLIISAIVFRTTKLHHGMWRYTSPPDLLRIIQCIFLIVLILFSTMFLLSRLENVPRSVLVIFGLLSFAGLCGSRIIYGCFTTPNTDSLKHHAKRATVRVVIAGNVRSTAGVAQTIRTLYGDFVQIVGVIGRRDDIGRRYQGLTVLGSISGLKQVLASLDVRGMYPHKLIAVDLEFDQHPDDLERVTAIAERHGLAVVRSTNLHELNIMDHVSGSRLKLFKDKENPFKYHRAKRTFDFCFASLALIFLSPLLLLIASISFMTLGRPVIFSQVRAGWHMREFRLIKFRTMRDPIGLAGEVLGDAERVSQFGQFLRLTRLDELPQLWNILVGDMSLVGPRPLHSRDLLINDSILKKRYMVLPGLTGWAQVNGGKLLSREQKMALDLYYIEAASFLIDLKIVLLTLRTVIGGEIINYKAINDVQKNTNIAEMNT